MGSWEAGEILLRAPEERMKRMDGEEEEEVEEKVCGGEEGGWSE